MGIIIFIKMKLAKSILLALVSYTSAQPDCEEGYKQDGENCVDIDEGDESEARLHHCGWSTHCVNTEGSYDCECDAGYEYDSIDYYSFYDKEGGTMTLLCKDIDECAQDESEEKLNNCDTNASCI